VIFLKDPACPFRIHGMSIVARWVKAAFARPAVVLGLLLGAFVALQCCLPLATAVKIGADEDYELSKAVLCLNGHRLYTEVWSDQPPLYVSLLTVILKHFSPAILGPRLLTTASTLLLLGSVFLLVLRTNGRLAAPLATGLLMASPGFLELSSSAMQEIPALAPVAAALCVLLICPAGKWRANVVLGGILFAVALQMKLIGIVYLPIALLILVLRRLGFPGAKGDDDNGIRANSAGAANGVSVHPKSLATAIASDVLLCGAVIALGFACLNWLTGNPLGIQLQQAWAAHLAPAQSLEYGSPAEHSFDWSVLAKNWDTSLPAVLGIVVLFRSTRWRASLRHAEPRAWIRVGRGMDVGPLSHFLSPSKGERVPFRAGEGTPADSLSFHGSGCPSLAWLPLAWLGLTLVVFSTHRPWWAYYYVHNALPLCWCAAVGLAALAHWIRVSGFGLLSVFGLRSSDFRPQTLRAAHLHPHRPTHVLAASLMVLFCLCALPWLGARLYLQESGIRQVPKLYNCRALKEIARFRPFTQYLFADQPIYSFHSGIPVPPGLAILSLKRFWTGEMSNARLVSELEANRPGLMLLGNDPGERCFQALLNGDYQLVYEDAGSRLYALKSIVRKAPY
jgi:hypothetical protein